MSVSQGLFIATSVVTLGAALMMVAARRVFHSILWMILAFFGVAGFYVLLGASFMAGLQLFIYIGGISVITIIAIMVTRGMMRHHRHTFNDPLTAAPVALLSFAGLTYVILQVPWPTRPLAVVPADDLAFLGEALVDPQGYLLLFEVTSLLLLAVLVGALYIVKER
jgi:NADH-quinone oxidoreductase subunit J